jgi:hypothetical protein
LSRLRGLLVPVSAGTAAQPGTGGAENSRIENSGAENSGIENGSGLGEEASDA